MTAFSAAQLTFDQLVGRQIADIAPTGEYDALVALDRRLREQVGDGASADFQVRLNWLAAGRAIALALRLVAIAREVRA